MRNLRTASHASQRVPQHVETQRPKRLPPKGEERRLGREVTQDRAFKVFRVPSLNGLRSLGGAALIKHRTTWDGLDRLQWCRADQSQYRVVLRPGEHPPGPNAAIFFRTPERGTPTGSAKSLFWGRFS